MAYQPLTNFFPTADALLAADLSNLAETLLVHLKGYEGLGGNSVYQNGLISQSNFMNEQTPTGYGQKQDYRDRQPEVNRALMEAWNLLERDGILIRDPRQPAPWFSISRKGADLLKRFELHQRWERSGLPLVKEDLLKTGGLHILDVGRPIQQRTWVEEWIQMREGQALLPAGKRASTGGGLSLVAGSRIAELRQLSSPNFDFQKLIRFCEELNTTYDNACYLGTALLTRGLLDHVPPVFGKKTFAEVANNHSGGQSFKEAMQYLENASRKISDGLLHRQIRKNETLPTPQQVCCGQQLDVLLAEIVSVMK